MRAVTGIIVGLSFALCCQFYMLSRAIDSTRDGRVLRATDEQNDVAVLEARVKELLVVIQEKDEQISSLQQKLIEGQIGWQKEKSARIPDPQRDDDESPTKPFPDTMASFLHGASRVRKDEFLEKFDYGLPEVSDVEQEAGQSEVLLLYSAESAMTAKKTSNSNDDGFLSVGPLLSVKDATEKCSTVNIVSIGNPNEASEMFVGGQCLALVGHEQKYHIDRFVKTHDDSFGLVQRETIKDRKSGEYLGRYTFDDEDDESSPARLHRQFLAKYLTQVDTLKSRLKPVLEGVAINNTVIVMVCNKEQSSLLHNFACACQAKGIRLDNAVVFPTDKETESLAKELGFATFYDEEVRIESDLQSSST